MKPVTTSNTNHNFGPPPNVTDGSIGDLPCQIVDEHGYREIVSVWELSDAERDAIAAGYNVRLGVGWIGAFPPVSLGVTHERPFGRCDPAGGTHFHGAGDRCECGAEPNTVELEALTDAEAAAFADDFEAAKRDLENGETSPLDDVLPGPANRRAKPQPDGGRIHGRGWRP